MTYDRNHTHAILVGQLCDNIENGLRAKISKFIRDSAEDQNKDLKKLYYTIDGSSYFFSENFEYTDHLHEIESVNKYATVIRISPHLVKGFETAIESLNQFMELKLRVSNALRDVIQNALTMDDIVNIIDPAYHDLFGISQIKGRSVSLLTKVYITADNYQAKMRQLNKLLDEFKIYELLMDN